jgi:hypothetical protein
LHITDELANKNRVRPLVLKDSVTSDNLYVVNYCAIQPQTFDAAVWLNLNEDNVRTRTRTIVDMTKYNQELELYMKLTT